MATSGGRTEDWPDATFRNRQLHAWFDHYVKGTGPAPVQGVQTLTQTCPDAAPSGGSTGPFDDPDTDLPFSAATWRQLAPGEVRHTEAGAQAIAPAVSDPSVGQAYDPIAGGGACATASGDDQPGAASYRLDPAPGPNGFTLMGSPTIIAEINSQGPTSQLAARLVDVDTSSGDATLVARGLYRPEINVGSAPTQQVFQLHPNGWKFQQGHVAKLELLANDAPYGRTSNGQAPITVSNLELRLPVLETPNGGLIEAPAVKVVPAGYSLASDYLVGGGDQDGDGVPDGQDNCPTAPGPAANNGCPTIGADGDGDGIPNSQDQCPNEAGTAILQGCPTTASPLSPAGSPAKKCKRKKRSGKKAAAAKRKRCKKKKGKKRS